MSGPCLLAGGCGSSGPEAQAPAPSLSEGFSAQRAFRRFYTRWQARSVAARASLEPELRDFIVKHGRDPRARQARVYLAWLVLDQGDLVQAEQLARGIRTGAAGPVRDLATVVVAAVERRQGRPERALALLRPLHGKIIDASERLLETSELVRSTFALKRYDAALDAMVDWVADAPDVDRESIRAEAEALIGDVPAPILETRLRSGDSAAGQDRERLAASRWLEKSVRQRLVRTALTKRDVLLAKRLLDVAAPSLSGDAQSDALARLAADGRIAPRVYGRAVGVVLRLGSDEARRRSAQVASGVSRALGIPETAARQDGVRLFLREAADVEYVDAALAGLAGDGAAVLVAGVTSADAAIASQFAERSAIPVLLLVAPEHPVAPDGHSFLVGVEAGRDHATLTSALSERGRTRFAWVGTDDAPCGADVPAGSTAFPVDLWKKQSVEALVLVGDALCTGDAVSLAIQSRLHPALFLGLESAHIWPDLPARERYVVTSGRFPWTGSENTPADMRAWKERAGMGPSWYEALGHDAALLAAAALFALPLDRTDDAAQVAELHERAEKGLAKATATLWTAKAAGFDGSRVLPHAFGVERVDAPSR